MGHLAPAATPIFDRYLTPGGVLVDARERRGNRVACYRVDDGTFLWWFRVWQLVRVK